MTMIESILTAMERLLVPKLDEIQKEQKALRELMEEKFRTVDVRFKALEEKFDLRFQSLEDKLALDKRLTALETRNEQKETTN